MLRRIVSGAALIAAVFLCTSAKAGDPALAEELFRQARGLMDSGDYIAACPKLEESFTQDPATGTLLALAVCQEEAGKTASAWATYGAVVARSEREGQTERGAAASERQKALEAKLSRLTVEIPAEVAATEGLVVQVGGNVLGQGAWGVPAPTDPGEHVVEVTAPGKQAWRSTVVLGAEADVQVVLVPALLEEPTVVVETLPVAPVEQQAKPAASPVPVSLDTESAVSTTPLDTIGLVVGTVGVVGLGVSGYLALRATSLNDDSKAGDHCNATNQCDATGLALREDAVDASGLATVFLVTGGVLTAAGATLYLVGSAEESAAPQATLRSVLAPGTAAVTLQGKF